MIEVENVSKSYDDHRVLENVSFSINQSEIFSLVGHNGAGKTTLVKCLTGVTNQDEGEIFVKEYQPINIDKSKIGVLPQEFSPPGLLTVKELLEYYSGLYKETFEINTVIKKINLEDAYKKRYNKLSGGQKRRICIGISIINKPKILFLDEPTTGIDPEGRRDIWDLINKLSNQGTTIFFTTHYMEEAEELADKVGILNNGELVTVGDPKKLIKEKGGDSKLIFKKKNKSVNNNLDEQITKHYNVEETPELIIFNGVETNNIGDIINIVNQQKIQYIEIKWEKPNLEDVYMNFTKNENRKDIF